MVHDRPESSRPDYMLLESRRLLERAARWLLGNRPRPLAERERERKLKAERSKRARALPRIQRDTAAEITRLLNRAAKDVRSALAGGASDYQAWALPQLQVLGPRRPPYPRDRGGRGRSSCLRRAGGAQCGSQAPLGAIPTVTGQQGMA